MILIIRLRKNSINFSCILTKRNNHNEDQIRKITNHIPSILTKEHNQMLFKKITMEELEEAVQTMSNGKFPGPDGFTIDFYKHAGT